VGRSYQNFVGKSLPITVEGRKVDVSTLYDVNQEVWVVDHEAEMVNVACPQCGSTGRLASPQGHARVCPSCQGMAKRTGQFVLSPRLVSIQMMYIIGRPSGVSIFYRMREVPDVSFPEDSVYESKEATQTAMQIPKTRAEEAVSE